MFLNSNKLAFLEGSVQTRNGRVYCKWWNEGSEIRYKIETPVKTIAIINGKKMYLEKGCYSF